LVQGEKFAVKVMIRDAREATASAETEVTSAPTRAGTRQLHRMLAAAI